eukprot:gnl/MRDRNA2_/MRDRNA2_87804_c0_seq1.p1 gnl/MRDRNA2_/MRDRNA2_87804_c0~~gnl/MRDRNA2_/MRDRNA2_87804_c0_seq1.p1  ORF type:complete len:173 (-),score=42.45 gnl/MRDRNA2_/MRDRNA2_87804_c0_seq1:69-587(-)
MAHLPILDVSTGELCNDQDELKAVREFSGSDGLEAIRHNAIDDEDTSKQSHAERKALELSSFAQERFENFGPTAQGPVGPVGPTPQKRTSLIGSGAKPGAQNPAKKARLPTGFQVKGKAQGTGSAKANEPAPPSEPEKSSTKAAGGITAIGGLGGYGSSDDSDDSDDEEKED